MAAADCGVAEGSTAPGDRTLLRFTLTTPNLGDGDLVIGVPGDHPEWFQWGECHRHWHFREYADYRLWTLDGYRSWQEARRAHPTTPSADLLAAQPGLRDGFVAGHKQGFCAIDVVPYLPVDPPKYLDCFWGQGVSRGWADQYGFRLDGQWVDVTGIAPGPYVLEAEVNPERFFQELDYGNNAAAIAVVVPLLP